MKTDSDYSGNQLTPIDATDISQLKWMDHDFDVIYQLEDGREAIKLGSSYYPIDTDGTPDFKKPIMQN